MKNFMSTILSAFKDWTKKEIKDSTADWNQNDSSANSYVKNRTHWIDDNSVVHTLDEKFIPDSIARVEDIPEINYPVTSVNGMTGDVVIEIDGGGSSVQADMAQNDPAQPDYVKNRTHWVEGSFEEILPETTLTMNDVSGYGTGGMITVDHTKITSGKTYKMVWDGVTYEAPAFEAVGQEEGGEVITAVAIGNPALANLGEDNGIPFCGSNIITGDMPTDDFAVFTTDTAATHTLSISVGSTTYHPLDEAFIPDTIARIEDVTAPKTELILTSSTSGSSKKFKITIDDTGTLTVSEIAEEVE